MNGEDILFAMTSLGFENYGEALKIYLARYREVSFFNLYSKHHILMRVYILITPRPWWLVARHKNQVSQVVLELERTPPHRHHMMEAIMV